MSENAPGTNGAIAEQFPPGYVERASGLVQAGHAAAADPLPGPLLDAFLPPELTAAGIKLRPLVASDWAILKKIDSPILKELQATALDPNLPKPEIKYEEEDIWELLFIFSTPPERLRREMTMGRENFRNVAMQLTADKLPFEVVMQRRQILEALAQNIVRPFATRLAHQPAGRDAPESFRAAPPATASAGGSIT